MNNKQVAEYLLTAGLVDVKGVVYLDEADRQMVLLRKGRKVVKLSESGLDWNERFTFYDQVSSCCRAHLLHSIIMRRRASVGAHDWYGHQAEC